MKLTKKLFAQYLGVSLKTAYQDYKYYCDLAGKKDGYLTIPDLCRIEHITIDEFKNIIKN